MQAVLNPNLPTPVPSLSGLGVASLSLLLAMVGMARGRKQ
ncbi:IPTL-CTERM sorting domain-containing protein [Comamonas sp. 4034]